MSKLLLSIAAAVMLPAATQADPAPAFAMAHETKIDCARELTCVAEMFADALSSRVVPEPLRLDSLVTFEPGSTRVYSESREKLQALAVSWRTHVRWSTIMVGGHAGGARNAALARRRADKIRVYLIRYGIPAEYVTAIGHGDSPADAATGRVDLAVELCERPFKNCLRPALAEARKSAQ